MIERCSCNALIVSFSHARIKDWRESHRHEIPEESEPPLIHESGSSHERDVDTWMPEGVRTQIGFRPNH